MKKTLLTALIFAALCSFVSAEVYSLYDPSYIYVKDEKNPDNLKWKDTVSAGFAVGKVKGTYTPAKLNNNPNKIEFAQIDYKGKEAYIIKAGLFESRGKVAVIKVDTVVYTCRNLATFENIMIPAGTVVIAEESSADRETNLQKISFFDSLTFWRMRTVYVDASALSTDKGDYDAVSLAKIAKTKDVKTEREIITKLLSSAENKAKSSEISDYVAKVSAEIDGKDIKQSPTEEFTSSGVINSNGSRVNVRKTPGTSGEVAGQLEDQTFVRTSKKTTQQEKIGGETDSWYYIITDDEEPIEGWIFGSSINWEK